MLMNSKSFLCVALIALIMKIKIPQFLPLISLVFSSILVSAQGSLNMTQLGHLPYNLNLSEVRGAVHNGREYALVGVNNGFSIVDVTDPTAPDEVFFEQGPSSIWRDPFYHNGHAYCVTEGGGGLLIVDMSPLPGSTNLPTTLYTGTSIPWSSAHNMFIDRPNNKAYIFGSNTVEGVIILDISNPMAPVDLGVWNDFYIHDGYVRGDTLWAACLADGAFVVNVSNPSNPVILSNWSTPSQFAHNIWPSDNNANCYTTDEVTSGYVAGYNMSNLNNVVETDKTHHPLSEGVIPHNTHFMNDFLITSHYRDGVTIHDVSDPSNIVLTGYFDSSPFSGGGFNGAWGAWPYLPSGNVLVADIEEGLFILGPTYVRAARLEGNVTEFGTGTPLNGVVVEITSIGINENTDLFGDYASGTAIAGTYSATFLKGGYLPQTVNGIVLSNGEVTTVDVELIPDVPFSLAGLVTDELSGDPIEGAIVQFTNSFFDVALNSDANGNYSDNSFFAGDYEYTVASWGHIEECGEISLSSSSVPPSFELQPGYSDDFALDLNWSVSGNAGTGTWERGIPVQTTSGNDIANPGIDADNDCGTHAFVTGNGGGSAGNDDVDDGTTILMSPSMDLTTYNDPTVSFQYWFYNGGGGSTPNDSYVVKIDNGTDVVTLASLPITTGSWTSVSFPLVEQIAITSSMRLIIEVADVDPGHVVEGGFDKFRINEGVGIAQVGDINTVSIYPNPARGSVNVNITSQFKQASFRMLEMTGRVVSTAQRLNLGLNNVNVPQTAGIYLCEVIIDGQRTVTRLLVHN